MSSTMPDVSVEKLIADYAELERRIGRYVQGRLGHVCAACPKPCCRPDICRQVVESWWLRRVSEHVHGKWWPDDWQDRPECIAMTDHGCLLEAGRPAICRSFVCDAYTTAYGSLWEAAFYSFLADLMWNVGQLSGRVHVEEIEEDDFPRLAGRLAERIAAGRRLLALAERLIDEDVPELLRHRVLLRLLCESPRFWRATTRRAILARLPSPRPA
ncbi:MAG: hypothetical protein J7M21_06575 [Planctomycetes bacterium]|nr:hypothetical protein [Planctomycetota bacterium]